MDSHEDTDVQDHGFITAQDSATDSTEPSGDHIKQEDHTDEHHRVTKGSSSSQRCVVLAGACFNLLVAMGFPFSVGALYVEIINTYSASRREAALVQGLCIGILFGAGILAGFLVDRFGNRKSLILGGFVGFLGLFVSWFATSPSYLIVTIGVVTGLGSSLIFMTSSVLVATAFGEARRLALPGMLCAAGVGGILLPKILEFLQAEYGLKGTLLVTSGLYLNVIPSGILVTSHLGIVRKKSSHMDNTDSKRTTAVKKLVFLKNPTWILFMITAAIAFGTANGPMVALVDFIKSRGYASEVGIQLLLIYNASNTVSRLAAGFLTLIPRTSGAMVFCFFLIVVSVSVLLIRRAVVYSSILALVVMFGVGYGGIAGICTFAVHEFAGPDAFPWALGVIGLFIGISNPTTASIMGLMYDLTGSYELPFLVYGIVGNFGAALTLVPVLYSKLRRSVRRRFPRRNSTSTEN